MCLQQGCGLASELQKRHRKNKEQDRGKEEQPHEDDPSSHVSPAEGSIQGSSPLVRAKFPREGEGSALYSDDRDDRRIFRG